jgi:SAM-dependent methyltransferase
MRDTIRAGIDLSTKKILKIGPLFRPFFLKSEADVVYVDHADTEALRAKYKHDPKFDKSTIVDVDAVWGAQTLAECVGIGRKVDCVIASHVIEHVPDLLAWLKELESVLATDGEIRLVVPDKRFTFDYTRRLTELPEVLDAYLRKARRPLPFNILGHVLNVRQVDTFAAWQRPLALADIPLSHPFELAIYAARDALSTENYHDVHCWVFTPCSLASLMHAAAENDLVDLECTLFADTPRGSLEFIVMVRPSTNKSEVVQSWTRMAAAVERPVPGTIELEIATLRNDVASLKEALAAMTALADAAREASAAHEADRTRLIHEVNSARTAEALRHVETARNETAAYKQSTSWKITAPLRSLVSALRR